MTFSAIFKVSFQDSLIFRTCFVALNARTTLKQRTQSMERRVILPTTNEQN